jgi:hypothetical protein
VAVGASDVNGIALTLAEGAKVSGRVQFDGSSTPMSPEQIQGMSISLSSTDGRSSSGPFSALQQGQNAPGRVGGDGRFTTGGYAPGKYILTINGRGAAGAGPGASAWMVKAAAINGRDAFRESIELTDHDLDGVVITFTDKIGQLTGIARDQSGSLATAGTVYLVPTDFRTTASAGSSPKRPRTATISNTGAFTFGRVAGGEYFIAAVADNDTSLNEDPSYYEALAKLATHVTIGDGEQKTFDVKIVKVER